VYWLDKRYSVSSTADKDALYVPESTLVARRPGIREVRFKSFKVEFRCRESPPTPPSGPEDGVSFSKLKMDLRIQKDEVPLILTTALLHFSTGD
jgi:hypothetical protein